jgi:large subunit ribosomal protein L19
MTGSDENNNTEETAAEDTAGKTEETTVETPATEEAAAPTTRREPTTLTEALAVLSKDTVKSETPEFSIGDTIKVHARIVEGNKERIQIFEGVVIKRSKGTHSDATFTVRKISYNVGVERTFLLHSPRVEKIEIVSSAKVRRARLFYLRPLRGKAARLKTIFQNREKKETSNKAA